MRTVTDTGTDDPTT